MDQKITVGGYVPFAAGDDPNADPDAAADALLRAGYHVERMTPADRQRLHCPWFGDDFILVTTDIPVDCAPKLIDRLAVEVSNIVASFGGLVDEFDVVGDTDRDPFTALFGTDPRQ